MEDGEGVSYETLQELLRQERRSNKMTPVQNGFWADLQKFLKEVEAEFQQAQKDDPWSKRAMMLRDRVINARHAAQAVWTLRERKLSILALAHAEDGGRPEGLTSKEKALYDKLHAVLREGREDVFAGTPAAPQPMVKPAPRPDPVPEPKAERPEGPVMEQGEEDEAPPVEPAPVAELPPDTPDDGMVTIRALGEIPPFVGPDMDTYHLKEGDMASVPENIADLLVRRGKAAIVTAM